MLTKLIDKTPGIHTTSCQDLLENLPFYIFVIKPDTHTVVYGNHLFRNNYEDWQNSPCHMLLNGLETPCPHCKWNELLNNHEEEPEKTVEYEYYNEFDELWYRMYERAIIWENGTRVHFAVAVDISELKDMQKQLAEAHATLVLKHKELEHIASTDSLTQIYNREKLGRVFSKEMRTVEYGDKTFSIISVDIDFFKRVNDTYGHATGDSVLITVARTMKESLRSTDYLGRWGGEEFLILCPETPLDDAFKLAERLRIAVANQTYNTGETHTVSIGIATYHTGDTLDSLLHRSDLALYRAKESGRNRVCREVEERA